MNLAHVEYYFADLLSVLESGRDEDGWTREPLHLGYPDEAEGNLPPRELKLPPNLYIVGTVNVDETTHAFSPKVLDRAFTLELTDADFSSYPPVSAPRQSNLSDEERRAILKDFTRAGVFARIDKPAIAAHVTAHPEVRDRLQALNKLLCPHDLHFGYRVFDEIVAYLDAAKCNKLYDDDDLGGAEAAFDAAVLMKVLPKFHGSRSRLEAPLVAVLAWSVNPDAPNTQTITDALLQSEAGQAVREILNRFSFRYPKTAGRAQRMLARLYTDGFAAFG
jgi:5-methylcytosine-specific restriction endonuclease McrBC GTP-binding regulatory subunit McrB